MEASPKLRLICSTCIPDVIIWNNYILWKSIELVLLSLEKTASVFSSYQLECCHPIDCGDTDLWIFKSSIRQSYSLEISFTFNARKDMCCSFCWYLRNCSPSPFKLSFCNVQQICLPQRLPVDLSMFYLFCICASHHHTRYYLCSASY